VEALLGGGKIQTAALHSSLHSAWLSLLQVQNVSSTLLPFSCYLSFRLRTCKAICTCLCNALSIGKHGNIRQSPKNNYAVKADKTVINYMILHVTVHVL
jgi:hypothetical protein